MGAGGEVVAEVAEGVLDLSEDLVVGQIDQRVGAALQEDVGLTPEGLQDLAAPLITPFRGVLSIRRGFVQHGDHPGVRSIWGQESRSIFPPP
jgi:hypothetical protein